MTGLLIKCYEPLPQSGTTSVQLTLPAAAGENGYRELQGMVEIKRQVKKDGYYHYGVEFSNIDATIRNGMEQIIRYFKKKAQFS